MKEKMISLAILLLISNIWVLGQDHGPAKHTFTNCNSLPFQIDGNDSELKQSSIILGWMWASQATISDALLMNQHDAWNADSYNFFSKGENICMKSTDAGYFLFTNHGRGSGYLLSRSMMFKPDLLIPTIIDYQTIANQCKNDASPNASIFGWKYIHPNADTVGIYILSIKYGTEQISKKFMVER